jgi:hypothetical protein
MLHGRSPRFGEKLWATIKNLAPPWKPTGVTPLVEAGLNMDWTGRQIESQGQDNLYTYLRSQPYTLETSKFMSKYLTQWLGLSPAKTEYVLDQLTGGQYSGITGFIERSTQGDLSMRDSPIGRNLTRGLYQRSISEFYDQYNAVRMTVGSDKFLHPDREPMDQARLSQLNRYKDVLTDLRKETLKTKGIDNKLNIDRYAVGMADYVLGKESRDSYPNPLAFTTNIVPPVVRQLREDYVATLAKQIISTPKRGKVEDPDRFFTRKDKDELESEWAAVELERLGYSPVDVEVILMGKLTDKGQKLSQESRNELRRGLLLAP